VVPEKTFEFGTVGKEDKVVHRFAFRNAGNARLVLQAPRPACGCTVVPLAKLQYEPGEEGTLEVTFNPLHKMGRQNVTVAIASNDPAEPEVTLTLRGTVIADVTVTPASVYFTQARHGQGASAEVRVRHALGQRLAVTGVEVSDPKALEATWIEALPAPQPDAATLPPSAAGSEIVITVRLRPERAPGTLQEQVRLLLDGRALPIHVVGEVSGNLTVTPNYLYFGTIERGRAATVSLVLTSAASDFEVRGVESTLASVDVTAAREAAGVRVTAKLREGWRDEKVAGLVRIVTNDRWEPVKEINVVGLVR
jgi:hypothetical protein